MTSKYGKNGAAVAAFLDEVRTTDLDRWRAFVALESPTREYSNAAKAARDTPLSASVQSAVYSASLKTVRGLGLADAGLGDGFMRISTRVKGAAMGLAVRDALTPEQLSVILEPFIALGFRSVAEPTPAPPEQ
jgi:hypothetical protein